MRAASELNLTEVRQCSTMAHIEDVHIVSESLIICNVVLTSPVDERKGWWRKCECEK